MTRILFLLSRFLDGGIDAVLLDYLRYLAQREDYSISLAISIHMGELEVFRKQIPEQVKVVYLVDQPMLTRWRQQKITQRLPFYIKMYDEALLSPIRRHMIGQKLRQLATLHDVVIDFDCCHYAYLKNVKTWKVAWFHFSFKQLMEQNRRRTQRIGNHLRYYDRIVTISQAMLDEGKELFPWLEGRWRLIYNAKDEELLRQRGSEPVDDTRINDSYILAIERLEESQKDLSTLIRAYQLLRIEYHHEEKLYLLGKGRDEQLLRQLAESLGISDHVVFLGFSSNPYPWIAHAKAIAHSAKFEGLPTVMIESLIMGKLIVATDCPTGPREILDQGRAGLLTPVGDAEKMAEALHRLLTDEALQTSILAHAKKYKRQFLFDHAGKLFDEVIHPS
jgi:glycosyltransferase involved in cell wall biosynthesis